ncbi:MAG: T9SS type A sorting domain-containing protein [Bacteroidetes bacterium]|nr:T9SS type A sorting domain-containing protein [Bacteroidota bacterium]
MKQKSKTALLSLLALFLILPAIQLSAQSNFKNKIAPKQMGSKEMQTVNGNTAPYCANIGFELQNFSGWKCFSGTAASATWATCPLDPLPTLNYLVDSIPGMPNTNTFPIAGQARYTLLTDILRHDTIARNPITGAYEIPYLSPGGSAAAVRLGNSLIGGEVEKLTNTFYLTDTSSVLYVNFATVQQSEQHAQNSQPFFSFKILDSTGVPLSGICSAYCLWSSSGNSNYFNIPQNSPYSLFPSFTLTYRNWTSIPINLQGIPNQKITIEFSNGDCANFGHFGYSYVDAYCGNDYSHYLYSVGDSMSVLVAPPGFASYQWVDSSGAVIAGATNDTLIVNNPIGELNFTVKLNTGIEFPCASDFYIHLSNTLSSAPQSAKIINFEVFPNPASKMFRFNYQLQKNSDVMLELTNILGETIWQKKISNQNPAKYSDVVDVSFLPAGIYSLSIQSNGERLTRKIVLN